MKTIRLLILGVLAMLAPSCTGAPPRAVGDWHGTIMTPRGELTIVVRIAEKSGGFTGELDSPDQAPSEPVPLDITTATSDRLAFAAPSIKGSYAGTWDDKIAGWSGTWIQSGYKFPLALRSGPTTSAVKGMDGVWEAKVQRDDTTRRIILRITSTAEGATIKFDAPDAGAFNLSVADFQREGDRVRFTVPAAGASFDGKLTGADRIEGTWLFPGRPPAHIVFARTNAQAQAAPRARPQTPKPPFPYRVEEVRVANPAARDVTLACTLTTPQGAGPFPAAALVTGSGGQDRDETIYEHKPFAVIADHLTRQGIAVLRCDDRGVAQSTGTFEAATSDDFATDADSMVAFLAGRADIKKAAIGLIGHSEGGLVSMIAASTDPRIAYLVLLAAPGTNLREMLLTQHRLLAAAQGMPESTIAKSGPILARILDAVMSASSDAEATARVRALLTREALETLGMPAANSANTELFIQNMANVWMRHLLRLNPAAYLSKIRIPVLALDGSRDTQVEPDANLAAIKAGLARDGDVTVRKLDGLNHFFRTAKTGGMGEYIEIEETFSPAALQAVSSWIRQRFAR